MNKISTLTLKDFYPFNSWKLDENSGTFDNSDRIFHIIDLTTGHRYLNQPESNIRLKSLGLIFLTPFAFIIDVAIRIVKILVGYHFWKNHFEVGNRWKDLGKDLLIIASSPLTLLFLEISATYGIICPQDGRKLYASGERLLYGGGQVSPCFQPNPTYHGGGGNLFDLDGW